MMKFMIHLPLVVFVIVYFCLVFHFYCKAMSDIASYAQTSINGIPKFVSPLAEAALSNRAF